MILNIETSGEICSVALADKGELIDSRESNSGKSHAALLGLFIEELFEENKICPSYLDAVAISAGPGSYTGLRIGVATAKGICYGADIPLIALNTMECMCAGWLLNHQTPEDQFLFRPLIDARRMEVYTALFNHSLDVLKQPGAHIITNNSFLDELNNQIVVLFGSGADKCKSVIEHENARFYDGDYLSAIHMVHLSWEKFNNKVFADTAYFEPDYLKEFQATTPKNNIPGL